MNHPILHAIPLGALCLILTVAGSAQAGNAFLDPAIRHTNGMRIASSEPHRASSVNWTCNPEKLGYCGGNYYRPCIDSVRFDALARARRGCYSHPCDHYRSTGCGSAREILGDNHRYEGVEPAGMSALGQLPIELFGTGGGAGPVAPPAAR